MPIIGEVAGSQKTVPNAPGIVSATDVGTGRAYNNGAVTVVLSAPAYTGRLPITSYTATPSSGSAASGASTTQTVTGLLSATNYTFTAYATNAVGNSPNAGPTGAVFATTVPAAPGTPTASAGNSQATVSWSAPADGGKAISGYTVTSSPGSITASTTSTSVTVTGLTNGTAYTFTVTATNANGVSAASAASNSVTPVAPGYIQTFGLGVSLSGSYAIKKLASGNVGSIVGLGNTSASFYVNDSSGTLQSQRQFVSNTITGGITAGGIDSSDNVIFGGYASNGTYAGLYKFNSSGTSLWAIRENNQSIPNFAGNILFDSSNNVYASAFWSATYPGYAIGKFNSSGTPVGGAFFSGGRFSQMSSFTPAAPDSSGNCYGLFGFNTSGSGNGFVLTKFDSAMNPGVQVNYAISGQTNATSHIYVDSSNNIYTITLGKGTNYPLTIARWNTSLGLVWQRTWTNSQESMTGFSKVTVDTNGDVYALLQMTSSGSVYNFVVAKYNSSGTLQYQRQWSGNFFGTNSQQFGAAISIVDNDYVISVPYNSGGNVQFRAPKDGSKTGSYVLGGQTYTYSVSSYSEGAGQLISGGQGATFGFWTQSFTSITASTIAGTQATSTLLI